MLLLLLRRRRLLLLLRSNGYVPNAAKGPAAHGFNLSSYATNPELFTLNPEPTTFKPLNPYTPEP